MSIQLDGFEQVGTAAKVGTFTDGYPARFVCHITQGFQADIAHAAATHPDPPQLWVCLPSHPFTPKRRVQTISLDRPGRALKHPVGTPPTNGAHAVQVEIEGWSETTGDLPKSDLDWLADAVIGPACAATGVDVSVFLATVGAAGAGVNAAQRMTWDQWAVFRGICGHQHVPGNDHWDPGKLDLGYISARLTGSGTIPPKPPTTKRGRMLDSVLDVSGRAVFVRVNVGKVEYRWQVTASAGPITTWADMQHPGDDPGVFDNVTVFRNSDGRLEVHAWNSQVPGAPVFAKWVTVNDHLGKPQDLHLPPGQLEFTNWGKV